MNLLFMVFMACNKPVETTNASNETPVEKTERIEIADLEHFGSDFTLESAVPAIDVLGNLDAYVDQRVRITGQVSDVCQKMGCWMVVTDADKHIRVTTKDHKFFVAKDGTGSTCDLEGVVIKRELNPERVEHFKSEQTEGAPLPEAQAVDSVVYEIVAEAIEFKRNP